MLHTKELLSPGNAAAWSENSRVEKKKCSQVFRYLEVRVAPAYSGRQFLLARSEKVRSQRMHRKSAFSCLSARRALFSTSNRATDTSA